jgi:hypothetical protein
MYESDVLKVGKVENEPESDDGTQYYNPNED